MTTRTTRFLGIPTGAMVSVTALQAGQSASLGPVAWGVDPGGPPLTPNATFSIVLEAGNAIQVAPHDQWFSVSDVSGFTPAAPGAGNAFDPQAHDITWIWNFGDPGSVPHPACNLPTAWRDTNIAYGKRVAHVFEAPGTYTVTCFAFDDDGNYGTATATVTVEDPATVFPGNRTICVNPVGDSDFAGAPSGAQLVQGADAPLAAALVTIEGQNSRILFKRGATFVGAVANVFGTQPSRYYAAYGTGADPVLRPATDSDGALLSARDRLHKLIGLDFHGRWNVETETGNYAKLFEMIAAPTPLLIHKCRIRDSDGLSVSQDTIVSASLIENWRGFAFIPGGNSSATARHGIIGSAMHMSPNACQGQFNSFFDARLGNFNGPVRIGQPVCSFFSASSFFTNTGWSANSNSNRPETERNRQAIQNCLRLGSDPVAFSVLHTNNYERIVTEGPGIGLMQRNASVAQPSNYVIDKAIVLGNHDAGVDQQIEITGGTTLRNVFVWFPSVPLSRTPGRGFVNRRINNGAGAANRRVRIFGCTFYSAMTSAQQTYADGGSGAGDRANRTLFDTIDTSNTAFTDLVEENNIIHCPVQNTPLTASAPVQMVAIPGLTTLYRGPRWNFPSVSVTLAADVPNGGTVTFPYPDDTTLHPNGRLVTQAYMLTPPGLGEHMLGTPSGDWPSPLEGRDPLRSARGQFSVSFGASNITVTNTSGATWNTGRVLRLLLDRRNDIGGTLTQFASPAAVEVPLPIAESPALAGAGVGMVPIDDLFGLRRRGAPGGAAGVATRGALEPA